MAGRVLLDHEAQRARSSRRRCTLARRLAGASEVTLAPILGELRARTRLGAFFGFYCHAGVLSCLRLLLRCGFPASSDGFSLGTNSAFLSGALLEAGAETRHEIQYAAVGGLRFGLLELGLLPLHLRLDDPHQVGAVLVGVATWVERLGQIRDELFRHLQLLGADLFAAGEVELTGIDQLVRKPHDLEDERFANDFDSREML